MASKKIDKVALVELIRSLDGINNDQRADLLQLLNDRKRYGLVWEEHTEDVEEQLREKLPVLKEVCERRILSDDAESPNHILIEGDNLHALIALTYTHEGKVDVIYIDPPYNTGNKDFIYNDSFVDAEDSFRHSKWLSFMKKRLHIAKRLLSDRGVIFISIDDNEQANLKLLCDEVFGSDNCMANMIWNLGTGTQAGHFTRAHEYVLIYAKKKGNIPNFSGGEGVIDHSALKKISVKNPPVEFTFKAGTIFEAPDGFELKDSWGGSEKTTLISGRMVAENGKLKYDVVLSAGFAMANQMHSWFSGKNTIDSKGQNVISFYFNSSGVLHYKKDKSVINPSTVLDSVGSTKQGTTKLKEIFKNNLPFDFAKPVDLICFLVKLRDKNAIILDFFAGSGTTLHATMQLNEEDGGKRQCILVTNNENNICEEVTYERNKRVIEGYTTLKGENVEGLKNNNLRYYKIDFVDRDSSVTAMKKLMVASTDLLCIKQDLYEEKDTFGSITLKPNIARYFNDGVKQMLIIYNTDAIESLVAEIEQMPEDTNIITYVFSTNNYPLNADFEDVADKVSLCALPAAINNAYRNVLPNKLTPKSDDHETETISGE